MANKVAVLIGIGPNEIEIPSMVFQSFDVGMEYVSGILGNPDEQREKKGNKVAAWQVNLEQEQTQEIGEFVSTEEAEEFRKSLPKEVMKKTHLMNVSIFREDFKAVCRVVQDLDILADKFFTSYYGGCGECYQLSLREADFGVPLVGFNLD
ncbi:hypothetical protein D3C71_1446270 [compost metagenome]